MPAKSLIIELLEGRSSSRVPVWAMRQAGRVLSRYRRLRAEIGDFKQMIQTPELATQVTLLPVEDLGTDAAIIFSDILVIPEAMGFPYQMAEGRGPYFDNYLQSAKDVQKLRPIVVEESLSYVLKALSMSKSALASDIALVGFSGAPWTLLAYLLEGGGSRNYSRARRFLYQEPEATHEALSRISEAVIAYLQAQGRSGADCLLLFDTLAEQLPPALYKEFGIRYLRQIATALQGNDHPPLLIFAKGAHHALADLAEIPCAGLSIDWMTPMSEAKRLVSTEKVLQGNFDPALLYASRTRIASEVHHLLSEMKDRAYIANLGHGLYPDTPEENVKFWVECVQNYPNRLS